MTRPARPVAEGPERLTAFVDGLTGWSRRLTFRVYGLPVPQGSTRAFMVKGRPVVTHASAKVRPWRQDVAAQARAAGATVGPGAVEVDVTFYLPRPKSRKKAGWPATRPDLDKLARAILDALTGIAWQDDGQVVELLVSKNYADDVEPPGATISLRYEQTAPRPTTPG